MSDGDLKDLRNKFITESSEEFADADPGEVAELLDKARAAGRYPDGCGPDCTGCDPCTCGHRWDEHDGACFGCTCAKFDQRFKTRIFMPEREVIGKGDTWTKTS